MSVKLLTEKQVAEIIGKSVAWLQRDRWKGDSGLPFYKLGRSVRYAENDVLEWFRKTAKHCTSTSQYDFCKNGT